MADRFPSLEDLDAGQPAVPQGSASLDAFGNEDPSDFLERERAALGEDANLFTTSADNAARVEEDHDDLLGGGGGPAPVQANDDMGAFETSFPSIDTQNEAVAPGGTITGSSLPFQPAQLTSETEPEVIREWRERRDLAISHRDQVSADKKAETVKAAHQAIDDFYDNYNNKKEKTVAQTRKEAEDFLKNREDTTSGGTSWERISKLVDLTGKGVSGGQQGTGKAKFRELLVNLRKDEKAPGATGY